VNLRPTRVAALAAGAVLALVMCAPALASAAPVDSSAFASRVESASAAVAAARSDVASGTVAQSLADAVDALLPVDLAVTEQTSTILVADDAIVHGLTGGLRNAASASQRRVALDDLAAHLESMRQVLRAGGEEPSDPSALRQLLATRPVTTDSGGNWLNQQIAKLLQAISDWLGRLNPPGTSGSPFAPARLIAYLVVGAPVLLVAWVLVRAMRRRRRRAALPAAAPSDIHAPVVSAAADLPADPLSYAETLASQGRHRDAVRALYGGAARHLADVGAVTRMRTRTNLEMVRDVRASAPALAPAFSRLTADFETAWYGHADPGGAGFHRARESFEAILDAPANKPAAVDGGAGPAGGAPR
jgi:hypothetical protein